MKTIIFSLAILMGSCCSLFSQSEGMKTNDSASIIKFESQDKGILIPRMTASQKNAISNAVAGLMIYQTDRAKGIYQYNGNKWVLTGHNPVPYQVTNGLAMEGNAIKINITGQESGDMFYYTGNEWIRIPMGSEGQRLCLVNGAPTWVN